LASSKEFELNEVGWWSHWVNLRWTGANSYVMLSSDFEEHFFNRAGFVDCKGATEAIPVIEAEFEEVGRRPCIMVQEECRDVADTLGMQNYTVFDRMLVLRLDRPGFKTAEHLTILLGQEVLADDWAAAYSSSFYGGSQVQDSVSRITGRLMRDPAVTLFAGTREGMTIGVLAAFRTPGLLGVYCVGTLDKYRRTGVAGSLIREASRVAYGEDRVLILQTMLSDGVENFYSRGGFSRLYLKHFFRRQYPGLIR